jgi:DNA-binding response OmpR family regulator
MTAIDFAGLDILVIEDDLMLARRLEAQLRRSGAEVTCAKTLQAARQLLGSLDFDFALLDVNLPDGLGTELLQAKVFPPATAIIVMTAHGGVAGAVEAMRLGAADYLVKEEINAALLERSIRYSIERHREKEELRRLLFKEMHPLEKLKRIGLGPLTIEGITRGRYRMIEQKEAEKLRKFDVGGDGKEKNTNLMQRAQRTQRNALQSIDDRG